MEQLLLVLFKFCSGIHSLFHLWLVVMVHKNVQFVERATKISNKSLKCVPSLKAFDAFPSDNIAEKKTGFVSQ